MKFMVNVHASIYLINFNKEQNMDIYVVCSAILPIWLYDTQCLIKKIKI